MVSEKRVVLDIPTVCHKCVKVAAQYKGVSIKDFVYHIVKQYMDQQALDDPKLKALFIAIMQSSDACEFPDGYDIESAFVHPHILPWDVTTDVTVSAEK